MTASDMPRFYYGWVIAFTAMLVLLVSNGMTLAGPIVFDELIIQEISAERALNSLNAAYSTDLTRGDLQSLLPDSSLRINSDLAQALLASAGRDVPAGEVEAVLRQSAVSVAGLKIRDMITLFTSGIIAFFAGALADRLGPRRLIIAGLSLLAVAYWCYGRVTTLWDIYLVHALMGVVISLAGLLVNVILVARWFIQSRGTAIGIALAGTSLGNAFFPPLNGWLLQFGDWRDVFSWVAFLPLAMVPVAFILLRDRPSNISVDVSARTATAASNEGFTLGEALRSRNFWMLALLAMLTFYSILAMGTHTFLFMREEGYSLMVASTGSTILFVSGLIGKVISGRLAEIFGRKRILLTGITLMLSGVLCLLLTSMVHSRVLLWVGLFAFGFGWGGIYTLIQLLCADLFGLRSLGKIMGSITVLDTFGGGLGPFITGFLYDISGGYVVPFMLISALLASAGVCASLIVAGEERPVAAT
ncbi:MAG: MFS transporter [Chromatocurvus sp.]